ncbi:ADP-ribosylation factor GTPase activating protein, ER-Golgi transport [Coemansia sp. RSA 2320]|nr:ADP-ribosylation factor GTPase activating protein, ER-Golgi transport [Coemansia sp. RSA 2320]
MKVGGNGKAAVFWSQNKGAHALSNGAGVNAISKYTSRPAQLYKEHLKKLELQDAASSADGRVSVATAEPALGAPPLEDDFFAREQSERPSRATSLEPLPAKPLAPPTVVMSSYIERDPAAGTAETDSSALGSAAGSEAKSAQAPVAHAINASSATSAKTRTTATLTSSAKPASLGAKKLGGARKLGGAKKLGATPIMNFEEAAARAEAEAREEERLQAMRDAVNSSTAAARRGSTSTAQASANASTSAASVSRALPSVGEASVAPGSTRDVEQLGAGLGRLGFGAVTSGGSGSVGGFGSIGGGFGATARSAGSSSAAPLTSASSAALRSQIPASSALAEASSDTLRFAGAKSISSDQFFGRPPASRNVHARGTSGEFDLEELSANARDIAQRLLNSNEADTLRRMWGQGTAKLSEYLEQFQEH